MATPPPLSSPPQSKGYGAGRIFLIVFFTLCISSVLLAAFFFCGGGKEQLLSGRVKSDTTLIFTPTEVRSIRETGEWEFLSIPTEELVEMRRKGLLSDGILTCIYRGRLRLGTDLRQAPSDAFIAKGDTALVRLPEIHLLSTEFIDETKTTVFHEQEKWSPTEKKALYEKARKQMMERALTEEHLEAARHNAQQQLHALFLPLGFKGVKIEWLNH